MERSEKRKTGEKIRLFFAQPELKFFVFILSLVIFSWPYINSFTHKSPAFFFFFYFIAWFFLILYLMLSCSEDNKKEQNDD
jgi:hypothetical protein